MKTVQHCVRISAAQNRTLMALAEQQGETRYRMMVRVITAGLSAFAHKGETASNLREFADEMANHNMRLIEQEGMLDRTLFTACAAYCYARAAATGKRKSDQVITAEINAAYQRQRRLSQEQDHDL